MESHSESQGSQLLTSADYEGFASGVSKFARVRAGLTPLLLGEVCLAIVLLLFISWLSSMMEAPRLYSISSIPIYGGLILALFFLSAYRRGAWIEGQPFLSEWARQRGWSFEPSPEDGALNAFSGRMLGLPGLIYQYPGHYDKVGASEKVVVRLELPVRGITAIHLRYRVHGDKPLMDSTYREIELESVEFNRMFRLEAGPAVSEVELRRLFDPETITFFLQSGADRLPSGFRLALENGVFFYITRGWVRPDTLAEIEKMLTQIEPFVRHLQALASARALS